MGKEKAMTTPRKPRLLPCPFCGRQPRRRPSNLFGGFLIFCNGGSVQIRGGHYVSIIRGTEAAAAKAWNTRRTP
jgi:hypothetical protein